jgi:hypothetical protein
MTFSESQHCKTRAHCCDCRSKPEWRNAAGAPDVCPHGVKGFGDWLEGAIKPFAKLLRLPVYDEKGKLKYSCGCAKRRDKLNALSL